MTFTIAVWVGYCSFGGAQVVGQQGKSQAGPQEFIDQYNEQFEKKEPVIGTVIGDLEAFDENGKKINFNDFRGKYTVLTFGCLT